MGIKIGDTDIVAIKLGDKDVTDVWLGDQRIFGGTTPEDEYQKVIDRMTTPSQAFQDAIKEYVEAEQAADGDNWALTDEIFFFNVDTWTNAMVGWKGSNLVSGDNSAAFTTYQGFIGDIAVRTLVEFDYQFGTNHTTLGDGWIMLNGRDFAPGAANNNNIGNFTPSLPSGAASRFIRAGGTNMNSTVFGGGSNSYTIDPPETTVFLTTADPDGLIRRHRNGQLEGGITRPINLSPAENLQWWNGHGGWHMGFGAGFSQNGFDVIANAANIIRFNDRMLVQKHTVEIGNVLARYTGLTPREEFAVGIFIARLIEANTWTEIDEVYPLALYTKSNSLIGMKAKTGAEIGTLDHVPGRGIVTNGVDNAFDTNFIPSVDAVNYAIGDAMISTNIDENPATVTSNKTLWGTADGSFQVLFRREAVILRSRLNSSTNMSRQGDNDWKVPRYRAVQIVYDNAGSPRAELYKNRAQRGTLNNYNQNADLVTTSVYLGAYNSAGTPTSWIPATVRCMMFAKSLKTTADASKIQAFFEAEDLMLNILEMGQLSEKDFNVQDKTYDYSERYVTPIELEELVTHIDSVTDSVTTGRVLDIRNNMGKTVNAQGAINRLTSVHGWTVTEL